MARSSAPKRSYLVKIVPPAGYRVFRLEFTRRHVAFAVVLSLVACVAVAVYCVATVRRAEATAGEFQRMTVDQRERLEQIDSQATELDSQLRALEKQNESIRKMMGVRGKGSAPGSNAAGASGERHTSLDAFATVADHIRRLRADSARARSEGDQLRGLALRVLNMRRIEELARARVLAAIPSINPAGAAGIASAFGWRVIPWPEFHSGVDLDADYGDPVRAAAAGTVVSAGWDGGYGIKIDIDHGNGYHTWYCHLSRADVQPGQYVTKAQHIALVGSTGESTGPHLHYQIMLEGKAVDPAPYLTGVPDKVLASLK